jgi:hypothetical protein
VQLLDSFPAIYETQISLPRLQELSNSIHPEPDQSSPQHPILPLQVHVNAVQPSTSLLVVFEKIMVFKKKIHYF